MKTAKLNLKHPKLKYSSILQLMNLMNKDMCASFSGMVFTWYYIIDKIILKIKLICMTLTLIINAIFCKYIFLE